MSIKAEQPALCLLMLALCHPAASRRSPPKSPLGVVVCTPRDSGSLLCPVDGRHD